MTRDLRPLPTNPYSSVRNASSESPRLRWRLSIIGCDQSTGRTHRNRSFQRPRQYCGECRCERDHEGGRLPSGHRSRGPAARSLHDGMVAGRANPCEVPRVSEHFHDLHAREIARYHSFPAVESDRNSDGRERACAGVLIRERWEGRPHPRSDDGFPRGRCPPLEARRRSVAGRRHPQRLRRRRRGFRERPRGSHPPR